MTVCGYQKCLKYVVKIAFNNGWMPRNPFALYSYTALNPDRSFLTEEELHRMMTTRLRYKSQDFNRDMFLFSCFTGICYADMSALTYDQLEQDTNGDWWISGNCQKTETKYVSRCCPIFCSFWISIEVWQAIALFFKFRPSIPSTTVLKILPVNAA